MNLILAERLVLLAHDQQRGRLAVYPASALKLSLNAALVTELLERGAAQLQGTRVVPGAAATWDPTLDGMLDAMRRKGRPRDIRHWVRWSGDQRRPMLERLVQQQVMRREEGRVLGIFPVTRYLLQSLAAWEETAEPVRRVLTGGSGEIPPQLASLVALASVCRLTGRLVAPNERRAARRRGRDIARMDPGAQAVARILRAQAAATASMAAGA
jgi:hypothetical protein